MTVNKQITIIDYQMGNPSSIYNMIKRLGYRADISSNKELIAKSDLVILPGVGAFDQALDNLAQLNLMDELNNYVLEAQKPILGICLGMQLFTQSSEEGQKQGFGWVKAKTLRFVAQPSEDLRLPHIGWSSVNVQKNPTWFPTIHDETRFYFVHSYYVQCERNEDIMTHSHYSQDFVSSFQVNNITGVQFHPEKSHKFGFNFFENYLRDVLHD